MRGVSDLLTTAQNIATALNNQSQTSLFIAGLKNYTGITTQTVVSTSPGRLAIVSVVASGTSEGMIYDASSIATATSARLLCAIHKTDHITLVNMPVVYGIVVTPGTGHTVAVSYS